MRTAVQLLSQYAAYHRDQRNITTHFVGVPLIVFAVGTLLARPAFDPGFTEMHLTPAWTAFALASVWYLTRHLLLGLTTSVGIALLVWLGHQAAQGGTGAWLAWGLGSFAIGWGIQFIGHYYEGRKPAFLDDLAGLLIGPMFITAEALFSAGWNPGMQRAIEREAGPTYLRDLVNAGP